MDDIPTLQTLARFDQLVAEMNLKVGNGSPLKRDVDLIRDAYNDRASLGDAEGQAKWGHRIPDFVQARITMERFVAATETLKGLAGLTRIVKDVLAGSISQDFKPSQAKDKLYELEFAATLKHAGFHVELREPDIVASGNGLSRPLAVACKYPSSRHQLHAHVSKGYKQITGQNLDGAVAIGLDLIVGKDARLQGILDFRLGDIPAPQILERRLANEVSTLQTERKRDYPAERPLDGLIMTVTIAGIDDEPPTLAFLNSIMLGCLPGNPLAKDLEVVKEKIEGIGGIR
jgi:hypothetical protein